MKTGRLIKFQRPGGEVQAYLYSEDGAYRAAMFLYAPERDVNGVPLPDITGPTEATVEDAVRAWVEKNYPRG
jgi:hypothetical protein